MSEVSKVVLCIQWPLVPARREGYFSLLSWGTSCSTTSQSEEAALLGFLDLSTTRVIAGKMHSQSPILKTKGRSANLVILTYLWEQSCILHTLTKTACLCFDPKNVFNAWRTWACTIPLALAGSVFDKVWLTRASRLANSQASASKAGVPGDPNLPESNCSYLALIWSVKELYSLCFLLHS